MKVCLLGTRANGLIPGPDLLELKRHQRLRD